MRILALDLSLTATGVADETGVRTIRPTTTGMERLAYIRDRALAACGTVEFPTDAPADLVVVEGYAYGRPQQATHLGELGGVVRLALWEAGIPCVEVAPASLKRYATGRGNAGKAEVMMAAGKRLGYDGHDDNESDALWLWHMAMDAYGSPPVEVPVTHRVALAAVKWPALSAAVPT